MLRRYAVQGSLGIMLSRLVSLLAPPLCTACGIHAAAGLPLCRACRSIMRGGFAVALPGVECWAAFDYDGPGGAMVRALKFGGRPLIADFMAGQIAAHAPPELLRGVVVPVPVHPLHRQRRGVDHAHVLANALATRAGLELCACLERRGDARPQVGRGRRERVHGPAGAVVVVGRAPRMALLVDDVVTTGATLSACARVLRAAGTAQTTAITYARTAAR